MSKHRFNHVSKKPGTLMEYLFGADHGLVKKIFEIAPLALIETAETPKARVHKARSQIHTSRRSRR